MAELHLGLVNGAGDRRSAAVAGCRGERDVAFAREQTGGRVESDPAGSRQVHLRPGVKVGEVCRGSDRTIQRLHVGRELNQVAGNEARGQTEMTQDLHEQPAGVAARAASTGERLFRRLDARLEPNDVCDVLRQPAVEIDEEIDGARLAPIDRAETIVAQPRHRPAAARDTAQAPAQPGLVDERKRFGRRFQKEVERIEDRQLGDQINVDQQLARPVGEDEPREVVAVRVLLPVDEVFPRRRPSASSSGSGVRQCGAGRRRMMWGESATTRS